MTRAVTAIYENGMLKPLRKLPLQEHQQVLVIIVPLDAERENEAYDPKRVAEMENQADAWLRQQPREVAGESVSLTPALRKEMDRGFDEALAALHHRSMNIDDEEIISDVATALAEARSASSPERQRLESEVQTLLDEIATNAS